MNEIADFPPELRHEQNDYYKRAAVSVGEVKDLKRRLYQLKRAINTPETGDWLKGVQLEAGHQQIRWGSDHDAGKTPLDWGTRQADVFQGRRDCDATSRSSQRPHLAPPILSPSLASEGLRNTSASGGIRVINHD